MSKAPVRRKARPASTARVAIIPTPEPTQQAAAPAPVEQPREAVPPSQRRRRGQLGGFGMKLSAPTKPGFFRRFVNDVGARIAELTERGYTLVEEPGVQSFDAGSNINRLAGTKDGGAPLKTYLMELPQQFRDEDRADMERENAVVDQAIMSGRDSAGGLTDRETYRPQGHENSIQIER